ncbi:MAG: DUF2628 domain-containing protein [Ruminococcus sp.]|nr:DUF2628 domain-containing protein [Ruminococcus sp.]
MDYLGKKCPVCDRYFHANDDVVVCPDCGTPHHRECYEKENRCFNADRHNDGYDFNTDTDNSATLDNVCPNCGEHNEKDAFFCKHCGVPMTKEQAGYQRQNGPYSQNSQRNNDQNSQGGFQGMPFSSYDPFDPMAGVDKNEDFGDSVTAGEAAKYVKQNTPYFIRVFSNIKKLSKSKFNFAAALFTGIYLMYRKMYKIGALITAVQLGLMILYVAISYSAPYQEVLNNMPAMSFGDMSALSEFVNFSAGLSTLQVFMIYYLFAYDLIRIALMITIGFTFNRLYFVHCKKQINKVKASAESHEEAENKLQTKGGVNIAIAVTLMISFAAVTYLPFIISNFF